MNRVKQRESGIELLKILAMFLIALSHMIQTLRDPNAYYAALNLTNYIYNFSITGNEFQRICLACLQASGHLGNMIFFICSAYFLLDIDNSDTKKVIHMIADVWIISIIFLLIFKIGGWYTISIQDLIKSILPNTFSTNWYITCYILFYCIHGQLNKII